MTLSSSCSILKQRLGGRNLYLVGMMGSGKSCTGPYLAEKLAYGFVDSDKVIEEVCGKPISMVFKDDGEKEFRTVETQVLNAIGERHSLIVATGGGIVTKPENWGVLHQGIVIWLNPNSDRLFARLQADSNERPLLMVQDPRRIFEDLLNEREKFYVESDLNVDIDEETPEEVATQILNKLPSILTDRDALNAQQTTAS